MIPLIKWAGGKSGEIKNIEKMIPEKYERYFEPFFGGGALFFDLEPQRAYINDITKELISFYKFIQNGKRQQFQKELNKYVIYWDRINLYMSKFGSSILDNFDRYRYDKILEEEFIEEIKKLFEKNIVPFNGLFSKDFAVNREDLLHHVEKNLIDKLNRIKNVIDKHSKFSRKEVMKNIETAFRSGFYIHFREIMNKSKKGLIELSEERQIANYYFVREFCYGGMFRFNRAGDFNIPYGGIGYNQKDFGKKVLHIFSSKVRVLLKRTTIENMDFKEFLNKHNPTENDFVFLDPPYDTEFSEYEENPFTKDDQERLAKVLYKMEAKFILIIKETEFIRRLYEHKTGIRIESFDKKYLYNVRGRNVRDVKHLIIHNIKDVQEKLL
ncbi:DNA adenine methylase [Candidatus Woesearchaeota archaeon]|nr:DNA adenine methylase [Candidatus Woesearchaeota archaeon]